MNVFTYYDDFGRRPDPLVSLWEDAWKRHGWQPVVLGPPDARAHPDFAAFVKAVSRFPTINDRHYELACYIRHLAMWRAGGGLMTDYDVMCYGFTPAAMAAMAAKYPGENFIGTLDARGVPCAIYGTPRGYEWFCSQLMSWPADQHIVLRDRPHLSDMIICQRLNLPREGVCVPYTVDGWEKATLVHFAAKRCKGVPKHELIRAVRMP